MAAEVCDGATVQRSSRQPAPDTLLAMGTLSDLADGSSPHFFIFKFVYVLVCRQLLR